MPSSSSGTPVYPGAYVHSVSSATSKRTTSSESEEEHYIQSNTYYGRGDWQNIEFHFQKNRSEVESMPSSPDCVSTANPNMTSRQVSMNDGPVDVPMDSQRENGFKTESTFPPALGKPISDDHVHYRPTQRYKPLPETDKQALQSELDSVLPGEWFSETQSLASSSHSTFRHGSSLGPSTLGAQHRPVDYAEQTKNLEPPSLETIGNMISAIRPLTSSSLNPSTGKPRHGSRRHSNLSDMGTSHSNHSDMTIKGASIGSTDNHVQPLNISSKHKGNDVSAAPKPSYNSESIPSTPSVARFKSDTVRSAPPKIRLPQISSKAELAAPMLHIPKMVEPEAAAHVKPNRSPSHRPPGAFPQTPSHRSYPTGNPFLDNDKVQSPTPSPIRRPNLECHFADEKQNTKSESRKSERMPVAPSSKASSTKDISITQVTQAPLTYPEYDIDRLTAYPPQIYDMADVIAAVGDPESVLPPAKEKPAKKSGMKFKDIVISTFSILIIVALLAVGFFYMFPPRTISRQSLFVRSFDEDPRITVIEPAVPLRTPRQQHLPDRHGRFSSFLNNRLGRVGQWLGQKIYNEKNKEVEDCRVTLMKHTFENSYGKPYTSEYVPPACNWTHAIFNVTVEASTGCQYDRLGMIFLDDVEVFRTSTAEPSPCFGIKHSFTKDMTPYGSLLRKRRRLIFDLPNIVDETYNVPLTVTLSVTYFTPGSAVPVNPAHDILPISAHRDKEWQPSQFLVPNEEAISKVQLPENTIRAIVSISASGNANEEFWWRCIPNTYGERVPWLAWECANSAFREIQLIINGEIVGYAWPYPTVFTGGINPKFWIPVVSLGAFDLRDYEIDITPWLPLILGREAQVEIKVFSFEENGEGHSLGPIGSNWIVSGKIFVWKDEKPNWKTHGIIHRQRVDEPKFEYTHHLNVDERGTPHDVDYLIFARRAMSIKSTIFTSRGPVRNSYTHITEFRSRIGYSFDHNNGSVSHITHGSRSAETREGISTETYTWAMETDELGRRLQRIVRDNELYGATARGLVADTTYGITQFESYKLEHQEASQATKYANGKRKYSTDMEAWVHFRGPKLHNEGVSDYFRNITSTTAVVETDREIVNGVMTRNFHADPAIVERLPEYFKYFYRK